MKKEIWCGVVGYEDVYEVSSFGRVKSLRYGKNRILKHGVNSNGYAIVVLCKNKNKKSKKVHQLVAEAFLNHVPCGFNLVVDHINDIKTDNRVDNLQIVTMRYNVKKTQGKYSSQFKGVCWCEGSKKWRVRFWDGNRNLDLGYFKNEIEASEAYQLKLKQLGL
jgi:hypothetical protein